MTMHSFSDVQFTNFLSSGLASKGNASKIIAEKLASKKVILKPSEDPVLHTEASVLKNKIAADGSHERSIKSSQMWITETGTVIQQSMDRLSSIRTNALSATDSSKNEIDLTNLAYEINGSLELLVQHANYSLGENYLLSGTKLDTPPFKVITDRTSGLITDVIFQGNSELIDFNVSQTAAKRVNLLGANTTNDPNKHGMFIDTARGIDIFKTVIQLRDDLLSNNTSRLSGGPGCLMDKLDIAEEQLLLCQAENGEIGQSFERHKERIEEHKSNAEQLFNDLTTPDKAQLMAEQLAAKASQEMQYLIIAKQLSTSLAHYIK